MELNYFSSAYALKIHDSIIKISGGLTVLEKVKPDSKPLAMGSTFYTDLF
jgi:hypothetical protein